MTPPRYDRPDGSEHDPYYAKYIEGVPDGDVLQALERQDADFQQMMKGVPEAKGDFAYAPGKWTLKEVLGHIADTERVFCYRTLRMARGDATPLPGFDENAWVPESGAKQRTLSDLLAELSAIRAATLALLKNIPAEAPLRRGTANNKGITVRALVWVTAGHALHHQRLIRERYLAP